MDPNTIIGVVGGFGVSIVLWFLTVKWLVARIAISKVLYEQKDNKGVRRFWITTKNTSFRDAVDVVVKCTLYSTGWGNGDEAVIATIDVPVSTGQIDILPLEGSVFQEDGRK